MTTIANEISAPTKAKPKFKNYNRAEIFNLPINSKAEVRGYEPGLENVPSIDNNYVFDTERLQDLNVFWVSGFKALVIEGDPAAGKTSLVEQWHARVNVPLRKLGCTPTTEAYKLIGQYLPTAEGRLKWHDGPVTAACREGSSVLLDEYNVMDPGETTALNLALEGKTFEIVETGEFITPHSQTRFFATQNPVDSKVMVAGRNLQDVANDDRFCALKVDYLHPDLEKAIVEKVLTAAKIDIARVVGVASICVDVANEVRRSFRAGNAVIEKPISTRVVIRWAKLAIMYNTLFRGSGKGKSGVHYALTKAVPMSESMLKAVNEMITLKAGYDENLEAPRSTQ